MNKSLIALIVSLVFCSCSVTLSTIDYDDLYYTSRYRDPSWTYYRPYWNQYPYSPFYYYQAPNIIIRPQQIPTQREPNRPRVEGGRSGIQSPQMRRGSRVK